MSSDVVSCEVAASENRPLSSIIDTLAKSALGTNANEAKVSFVSTSSMPAPPANAPASIAIVN
jgi:hypothetical protein